MSQITRFRSTAGLVLALCAVLAGCNSRTNVSATGSTPNQFTHVFISAGAVWFNTSAGASPTDSGWSKFPLKTAITVDLVQQSNGTLGEIANDLRLAPGTYNSILLLPATTAQINDATFAANLTAVGATYPQEADFVDNAGNSHQVALVLPNPELGISIPGASLKVPVGSVGAGALGATGTTGTSDTLGTSGITTTGTGATTTTTGTTSTESTTTTVSFGTNFDANRDLHPFCYAVPLSGCTQSSTGTTTGTTTGVIFGPRAVASDLSTTGGITGTVTLTLLTNITAVSGRVAIQASAEQLSADGSHFVIIASAPVQSDGTFTIYPLQSNSATPTVYDVVIHGPTIATIIIKNVAVATTTPSLTGAASTAGSVATTTATGAVSLGTFTPRQATAFTVQVAPNTSSPLPAGAAVTFYQTLPSNPAPYAIDEVGIDPVSGNLQTPEMLSLATIDSGTYSSSGSTITVTSASPVEGASSYHVAATAPLYTDGAVSSAPIVNGTTATAPTTSGTTTTYTSLSVTVPGLTPADGSAGGAIAASVTESSPGLYSGGELLVSHNGAVIGSAAIPSAALLSGSGTVTVSNLPSGTDGTYSLSAILWSATAFQYESVASPVNLSGGTTVQVAVPLN